MVHDVVIKIRDANGDIVAVDEIALPEGVVLDDLLVTITTVSRPPRMQRQERSPLSPDALVLADLKVGMHIRVNHKDNPSWSYCAMVAGEPTTNEYDNIIIPLIRLGEEPDYITGYPEDMGLMRYVTGLKIWNRYWYTTIQTDN